MSEQPELFESTPWAVRLSIPDALRLFWETYFQHLPSAKTCEPHRRRLASFFKAHYLDNVSKSDVEGFRRWMKAQRYAEPTINKAHMILTRMFNKLREYQEQGSDVGGVDWTCITLPDRNPGSLVKKVNEREYARKVAPAKEKVFALVSYAKQFGYHDLADIIEGLYLSRLRQSDFYRITASNVDLDHNLIQGIQHKTVTTSNPSGVVYLVAMSTPLRDIVARKLRYVKPGSRLFPPKNLQKRFDKVRKAAGLGYVTLQDLRRAAATHLLDNGVDPQTVSQSLGHTTLRMLPSYTPRTLKHHREASEKLVFSVDEK